MKKESAVSNEELISAMLSNTTIKATAQATGISTREIYNRMKDNDFITLYDQARTDLLRETVKSVNAHLMDAIDTVAEIMDNEENNPAVRLQASQYIISNAGKLTEQLDREETRQRNISNFNALWQF